MSFIASSLILRQTKTYFHNIYYLKMAKKEPDLIYSYNKIRKDFGRQPMFCETPAVLLDSIEANIKEQTQYCLRNPVNRETQTTICLSEHEVNTKRIFLHNQGVHHAEGGWPKEIICTDEEATTRYKRRIERDETYVDAVISLYPEFVHYIDQNNAIEMYNMYFKGMPPQRPVEKSSIHLYNTFNDPENRPIGSIGWTYEEESKLVVAYCNKQYPVREVTDENHSCYVWNIENSSAPLAEFCPPSACWQTACSPIHSSVIIGGLQDGRVCIFDIRASKEATLLSETHVSHREPVTSLLYLISRLNNEFFSGSTDGRCLWWDLRNISQPIDSLIMSIRIPPGEQMSLENAEGVSALQYDRSFPTKFLCGTDTGFVINVNRKGKTYGEVMSATFQAHNGPVKSVHRHRSVSKIFITCGDWRVNIWCDDIHSSPIITGIGHQYEITDVVWAPRRVSSYISIGRDGILRYWDLLRRWREPLFIYPVSKYALSNVKPHHEGKLLAIGDVKGTLSLLSLSENLVTSESNDKQLITQTFEREIRREHILETRVKEIRLKTKLEDGGSRRSTIDEANCEIMLRNTEEEYRKIVTDELRNAGGISLGGRTQIMRKR